MPSSAVLAARAIEALAVSAFRSSSAVRTLGDAAMPSSGLETVDTAVLMEHAVDVLALQAVALVVLVLQAVALVALMQQLELQQAELAAKSLRVCRTRGEAA